MSRLVEFYRGAAADTEGRRLADVWNWDDDAWEEVHDFIQWLFPLPEPSRFNPDAPLLTPQDIDAFGREPRLRENLRRSLERFLTFLGLSREEDGRVVEAENFAARAADAWAVPNHNWLRISRVLRSLTLLGLPGETAAFFAWLRETHLRHRFPIGADTFRYWEQAIAPSHPPTGRP
jgi:hypothetical protein